MKKGLEINKAIELANSTGGEMSLGFLARAIWKDRPYKNGWMAINRLRNGEGKSIGLDEARILAETTGVSLDIIFGIDPTKITYSLDIKNL